jgi:glycosyltransferase involved in cell wall biosynthesis
VKRPSWWPISAKSELIDPRRVVLVTWNANGPGGVARTVLNLANHLSKTRNVEVVSVVRRGRGPKFPVSREVRITYLGDESEDVLGKLLVERPPSVVISTRTIVHRTLTRFGHGRHVLIGQDHLNFETRMSWPWVRGVLAEALQGLDCFAVLTEADAKDYREYWPEAPAEILVMRNATSFEVAADVPSLSTKVVLAAGRLHPVKGFPRLIEAWAPIAAEHPDWQLHICGVGPDKAELLQQIADHKMSDQVRLLGHVDDLRERMRDAAFLAMTSRAEGFPMVLIEAMSQGLPAIAFDCPRGPAEIITDGWNGRLIPDGDIAAFTEALRALINDIDLRRGMGAAALEHGRSYEMDRIGAQWEVLIDRLTEAHNQRREDDRQESPRD